MKKARFNTVKSNEISNEIRAISQVKLRGLEQKIKSLNAKVAII